MREPASVLDGLVSLYIRGLSTRDELFAGLTKLVSARPYMLDGVRTALALECMTCLEPFDAWLRSLEQTTDVVINGQGIRITEDLLRALEKRGYWGSENA